MMSPRGGGALVRFFRTTPVTAWLIVVCTAFYLATAIQARSLMGNNRSSLFLDTALYPPVVAASDQWWRLLTAAFEHFGPLHLLLNMYMLWILGIAVERSIGHLRYLVLFLVSALGGSAAVMVFSPEALTAGASGGIFGLMGAYAVVAVAQKVEVRGIVILIALNVFVSLVVPGVSLAAHIGGLLAGGLGAGSLVVMPRLMGARGSRITRLAVVWVATAVVTALVLWVAWYGAAQLYPRVVRYP